MQKAFGMSPVGGAALAGSGAGLRPRRRQARSLPRSSRVFRTSSPIAISSFIARRISAPDACAPAPKASCSLRQTEYSLAGQVRVFRVEQNTVLAARIPENG